MQAKLDELKARLLEISDLTGAAAVLNWDQATYMPRGGGPARGRQLATLSRLAHERLTDAGLRRLLDDLRPYEESLPYDADDASLIRVARRDADKAAQVPAAFMADMRTLGSAAFQAWTRARPANDFAAVAPYLEQALDMSRRLADYFPGYDHIADPLIDYSDYGMKAADIRRIFGELRRELVPLVQAALDQPPADDSCLHGHFPEAAQWAFGEEVIRAFGYDFERGRQDKTYHPFATKFSVGDVRITTRFREGFVGDAMFSTMHESGHAMYEQGVAPAFEGTPLNRGASAGVHESQSRLWENIVGRSRGFWECYYPRLQTYFPDQLGGIPLDRFYPAINKVERSLIRTDADELTYNLHVMLRFDLELDMLEGRLAVRDLPEAWRARYQSDLGITAPDDRDGVLQDVHWYGGRIGGAFQGYTLGNILSAQFYEAALQAHPDIPDQVRLGDFATLHGWLRDNIYRHGRKFTADELVRRVTGRPLTIDPYLRYLRDKYPIAI